MKKIILISGHAQNGKDTLAEVLKDILSKSGNKVVITRFAKHLKQILIDYYGWDGVTKNDYWRDMLQKKGTEKIRFERKDPHFHVARTCEEIDIVKDDIDYVIIPDCRFPNEIYYTKACFPESVDTVRINRINFESPLSVESQSHISETALDNFKFDFNIINNDMESLYVDANNYIQKELYK